MSTEGYFCYREVQGPTAIVCAAFFQSLNQDSQQDQYLFTATIGNIAIYHVQQSSQGKGLKLMINERVFGHPQDVVVAKDRNSAKDTLIISFDDGKYTQIRYNGLTRSIELVKLCNVEESALGIGSLSKLQYRYRHQAVGLGSMPVMCIDSNSDIVCSILYGQYLNIMSFTHEILSNNDFVEASRNKISKLESSQQFIVDLNNMHEITGSILDICFIDGYSKPTVALLMESNFLPIGHAAVVKHTCAIVVLTIDVVQKSTSLLWKQEHLPHDSVRMLPITSSKSLLNGSIFLVSVNAIQLVNSSEIVGVAMNGFAPVSIHPSHKFQVSGLQQGYELDGSNWICSDSCNFIGSLKEGSMIHVRLIAPANATACNLNKLKIELNPIVTSVRSSCMVKSCDGQYWFLGSRIDDCPLLEVGKNWTKRNDIIATTNSSNACSTPASKKQRRSSMSTPGSNGIDTADGIEAEETELYGCVLDSTLVTSNTFDLSDQHLVDYDVSIIDTIPVIPPIQSCLTCRYDDILDNIPAMDWTSIGQPIKNPSKQSAGAYIADFQTRSSIVFAAGSNESSALFRVTNGCRYSKIVSKMMSEVHSIYSICHPDLWCNYLCLSYSNFTKIVQLSADDVSDTVHWKELSTEQAGFSTITASINFGLVHPFIAVQVFSIGIRLVKLPKQENIDCEALQDMPLLDSEELGGLNGVDNDEIVQCDIVGDTVCILTKLHHLYIVQYQPKEEMLQCRLHEIFESNFPVHCSLFNGLLSFQHQDDSAMDTSTDPKLDGTTVEEAMLYSDNGVKVGQNGMEVDTPAAPNASQASTSVSIYLSVVREFGNVEIISIGDKLEVVYECDVISAKPNFIDFKSSVAGGNDYSNSKRRVMKSKLGYLDGNLGDSELCWISVLANAELVVYRAESQNNSIIGFKKIPHTLITKALQPSEVDIKYMSHKGKKAFMVTGSSSPAIVFNNDGKIEVMNIGLPELPYSNQGGCYQVAQLGLGATIDGLITLWSEYQISRQVEIGLYQSAPNILGFKSSNSQQTCSITKMHCNDITAAATAVEDLNLTIHNVQDINKAFTHDKLEISMLEKKTFLLSCSQDVEVPFNQDVLTATEIARVDSDFAYYFTDLTSFYQPSKSTVPGLPPPCNFHDEQHRIALMQDGQIVDEYFFGEDERIVTTQVMYLTVEKDPIIMAQFAAGNQPQGNPYVVNIKKGQKKAFIFVGTCFADKHGEDNPCDGRLLIFTLDYNRFQNKAAQITHQAAAETVLQPKLNLQGTYVGPASVVKQFGNDRILSTVGTSIIIYKFDPVAMKIDQISFYYAKFCITAVTIVKNFIFIADCNHRVEMLVWRDEDWSLHLVSKDYNQTICRSVSNIHSQDALYTVIGDSENNLQVLQFDPKREIESIQGVRLIAVADMHVGSEITSMTTHNLLCPPDNKQSASSVAKPYSRSLTSEMFGSRFIKTVSNRSALVFGTMDGMVGLFFPVEEKLFKRLYLLQHLLIMTLESICALNPKDYRALKTIAFKPDRKKGVLDGTILWQYVSLPSSTQDELSKAMGTTTDIILNNLYELNVSSQFF